MAGRFRPLTLQQKVTLVLLVLLGSMVGFSYLVLGTTVKPAFESLESTVAEINLVRAKRAIQADLEILAAITGDWAPWDDAYEFVRGERPEFVDSNLDESTLENLGLGLMLFYDAGGRPLWQLLLRHGQVVDPNVLAATVAAVTDARLVEHEEPTSHTEGLLSTPLGPMLVSSRPVVRSVREGPIAGTVVMGQLLDVERQEGLRERTEVDLQWHALGDGREVEASLPEALLAGAVGENHHVAGDELIRSYAVLPDLAGGPLLVLQANTPRRISVLGERTVEGTLLLLSAAGLALAVATWWLLRSSIVLPLERLARHITGIRESGNLALRLNERRADEIGALASEFDLMTQRLHDARQLLLEQSFRAGKADTAAEVLHNVRNEMTPLINGIERLAGNFRFTSSLRVREAAEELADPACPEDRRTKLLEYVTAASEHVRATSGEAVTDLELAARQARQVEAIVGAQEAHTNAPPVVEEFDVRGVLEEAVLVLPMPERAGLRLNLEGDGGSFRIKGHRVRLLQVLGKLVLNAYESIERSGAEAGEIAISASAEENGDRQMIRITVCDTGCGFEEGVRGKLFQRGYSSKAGGSAAPGLHWCANAVASMGGRIMAESAGPGTGARFHVLLPEAPSRPLRARAQAG